MMLLRVTLPNGGDAFEFWAPLSYKLEEIETFSFGGGVVEILSILV